GEGDGGGARGALHQRRAAKPLGDGGQQDAVDQHALLRRRSGRGREVGRVDEVVPGAAAVVGGEVDRDRAGTVHATGVGRNRETADGEHVHAARAGAGRRADGGARAGGAGRHIAG